jgi:hypothetical protein
VLAAKAQNEALAKQLSRRGTGGVPMPQSFSRIDRVSKTTATAHRSQNFVMLFVTKKLQIPRCDVYREVVRGTEEPQAEQPE